MVELDEAFDLLQKVLLVIFNVMAGRDGGSIVADSINLSIKLFGLASGGHCLSTPRSGRGRGQVQFCIDTVACGSFPSLIILDDSLP